MHKPFYASGFLFHKKSEQILLYNRNSEIDQDSNWQMIGADNLKDEDAIDTFSRAALIYTGVCPVPNKIFAVYDYFHAGMKKDHFVFVAEVGKTHKIPTTDNRVFQWFSFKQVLKLSFTPQTKQDITVSERVIRMRERVNEEKVAFPKITF